MRRLPSAGPLSIAIVSTLICGRNCSRFTAKSSRRCRNCSRRKLVNAIRKKMIAVLCAGTLSWTVVAAGGVFQREEYTRNFQKNVPWQQGQLVRIDHRQGGITIRTHKQ